MKVLLADDDPDFLTLCKTYLEERGWRTVVARDALQASTVARRDLPDAVISDINMPGGSGIRALKQLKASPRVKAIPIIVVSGRDDEQCRERFSSLARWRSFESLWRSQTFTNVWCSCSASRFHSQPAANRSSSLTSRPFDRPTGTSFWRMVWFGKRCSQLRSEWGCWESVGRGRPHK